MATQTPFTSDQFGPAFSLRIQLERMQKNRSTFVMPQLNQFVTSSLTRTMFFRTTRLLEVRPPTPSAARAKSQSTRVRWYWIQSGEPSACSSFISTQRQKLRQPRRATCLPAVSAELQHRPTEVNWLPFARRQMSFKQSAQWSSTNRRTTRWALCPTL